MPKRWGMGLLLIVLVYAGLSAAAFVTQAPIHNDDKTLVWGGDMTGGAPFIMMHRDGSLYGFDADLAAYLAGELNMKPEFSQGKWDQTLPRLYRGDIDIALNGFEYTKEREQVWRSTIPYYVYSLQLMVRKGSAIRSWDDLLTPNADGSLKSVGVLSNSSAYAYLTETDEIKGKVNVLSYSEGVTSAMLLVQNGAIDASLQDYPAYAYYLLGEKKEEFPNLEPIGEPVGEGFYVIYVDRDDTKLLQQLNTAILKAIKSGKLKEIFSRYKVWNAAQAKLDDIDPKQWPPKEEEAEPPLPWYQSFLDDFLLLLQAALTTVLLACLSMPLAMLLGLGVAVGRLYGPGWLSYLLRGYVELIRGTPLLMQLLIIFLMLPVLQDYLNVPVEWRSWLTLPPFWAGVIGLAINYSAYEAENYRAGLMAIPKGQMEAALALGMPRWTALRRIIIPQAVKLVIPPVTNDFIALFKDTSVCSVIAVVDLTGQATAMFNNNPSLIFRIGVLTAILYLLMSYPLSMLARRLEKQFPRVVV